MNISSIRPDNPTIAIEGQAIGEEPVNVSQDGWTAPKRSNYDMVKSMAVEELAAWLADHPVVSEYDENNPQHKAWLDWLKQEAKE